MENGTQHLAWIHSTYVEKHRLSLFLGVEAEKVFKHIAAGAERSNEGSIRCSDFERYLQQSSGRMDQETICLVENEKPYLDKLKHVCC
jgi:hypothetical protein